MGLPALSGAASASSVSQNHKPIDRVRRAIPISSASRLKPECQARRAAGRGRTPD